jgi:hypothetical protein
VLEGKRPRLADLAPSIAHNLSILSVNAQDASQTMPYGLPTSSLLITHTLGERSSSSFPQPLPSTLRLILASEILTLNELMYANDSLARLFHLLNSPSTSSSLRLLFLPSHILPPHSNVTLAASAAAILGACICLGIEVVYEDASTVESSVSPAVWSRAGRFEQVQEGEEEESI